MVYIPYCTELHYVHYAITLVNTLMCYGRQHAASLLIFRYYEHTRLRGGIYGSVWMFIDVKVNRISSAKKLRTSLRNCLRTLRITELL